MNVRAKFLVVTALVAGFGLGHGVQQVQAAFYDRDKLARALARYFQLDERKVGEFLADFQYHPEKYATETNPRPTPSPTVSPTPTPSSRVSQSDAGHRKQENGATYEFDEYTDEYYWDNKIEDVQDRNNLKFVQTELAREVREGRLTRQMQREILDKLEQMMKQSPSTGEFLEMNYFEQRASINKFKKEMDAWMKSRDMTMGELREMTGKGNKFLMGIYY